jgi:hypothetical protein
MQTKFYVENEEVKTPLERSSVNRRTILIWFLNKQTGRMWNRLIWLGIGPTAG